MPDEPDLSKKSGSSSVTTAAALTITAVKWTGADRLKEFDGNPESYKKWRMAVTDIARINGVTALISSKPRNADFTTETWTRLDDIFMGILYMSLSDEVRLAIDGDGYTTTRAFIDAMDKQYQSTTTSTKYSLLMDLLTIRGSGKSVSEVWNEFKALKSKLLALSFKMDDLWLLVLLKAFGEEYEIIRQMITASEKTITCDEAITKLFSRESELKSTKKETEIALRAEHYRQPHPPKQTTPPKQHDPSIPLEAQNKSNLHCVNCGGTNHRINKCYHNGGGGVNSSNKPKNFISNNLEERRAKEEATVAVSETDPHIIIKEFYMAANPKSTTSNRDAASWIIDSGCSNTSTFDRSKFITFRPYNGNIIVGDGRKITIQGIGTVMLTTMIYGQITQIAINDAHYIPDLTRNLISYGQLTRLGYHTIDQPDSNIWNICNPENHVKLQATRTPNNLYEIITINPEINHTEDYIQHRRMGHMGGSGRVPCEVCHLTKMTRPPANKEPAPLPNDIRDIICSDVWGPFPVASKAGSKYFVSFIDAKSSFKNLYGTGLKTLRSDNGGEYISKAFRKYTTKEGRALKYESGLPDFLWPEIISHANRLRNYNKTSIINSTPYEAYYNKPPEIRNIHVFGSLVTIVKEPHERNNKLGVTGKQGVYMGQTEGIKGFLVWLPTVEKLVYCTKFQIDESRLYKDINWTHPSKSPPLSQYNFIYHDDDNDEISHPTVDTTNDVPLLADHESDEESDKQSVATTDEEKGEFFTPSPSKPLGILTDNLRPTSPESDTPTSPILTDPNSRTYNKYGYAPTKAGEDFIPEIIPKTSATERAAKVKAIRAEKEARVTFEALQLYGEIGITYETMHMELPSTYKQAASNPNWRQAMQKEMDSFGKHKVFSLVERSKDMKLLGGRWVFATKQAPDNSTVFKARYVAKGYRQRPGLDFIQTYAPTTISTSLRIVLSIIASNNLPCHQLDVSTAFLHGHLDVDLYMKQPEGFVDKEYPNHVVKLNRSIYGLKQSSRLWNVQVNKTFLDIGLKPTISDPTIYTMGDGPNITFVVLYVDDILVASKNINTINSIKTALRKEYDIKDLGNLDTFIGIQMTRDLQHKTISLKQSKYIQEVIDRFELSAEYATLSPEPTPLHFWKDRDTKELLSDTAKRLYQALIGALLWIATNTRPDISAVVGLAAQSVSKPTTYNWESATNIVRYLKGTIKDRLVLGGADTNALMAYVDASWEGTHSQNVKSCSRHGTILMYGNSCIGWWSRVQSVAAQSSAESEYIALCEAAKEIMALRTFLSEIGCEQTEPTIVMEDNQACIQMVNNGTITRSTRHIAIRERLVIQQVMETKSIELKKIHTSVNAADLMTKPLGRVKINQFKHIINIITPSGGVAIDHLDL
ncbi:DNA-directed DNA polymerase, partial [Synchytrium endobioticum]